MMSLFGSIIYSLISIVLLALIVGPTKLNFIAFFITSVYLHKKIKVT